VFPSDPLNPPNKQTFAIVRERQGPFIVDELGWIYTHMLQLDFEAGVGLDVDTGASGHDPSIEMTYSDDNARSWSLPSSTSGGRIGERRVRAIWRRLGRSRKRLYRIRVTDPVKWAIVDAYARITKGTS
jgi:mannosyltransferase OCH1-like enzyme